MATLGSILLNRNFLKILILAASGICIYFAYRDYLQIGACWQCFYAGKHDERLELRQDSIAAILVAIGVLFESLEVLAKKTSIVRHGRLTTEIHATSEACSVKGAFVVVLGLLIEMVNQVSQTLDGNHALIHLVKTLINLPLGLIALALLLVVLRDLCRVPKPDERGLNF